MTRPRKGPPETFECPHCGAAVVVGKRVCRECGSDASTGWQDEEVIGDQSLGSPDGYGPGESSFEGRCGGRSWLVAAIAVVVAVAFLLLTLLR